MITLAPTNIETFQSRPANRNRAYAPSATLRERLIRFMGGLAVKLAVLRGEYSLYRDKGRN